MAANKTVSVSSIQDALKRAQQSLDQSSGDYRSSIIAGGGIRDAIARAVAEGDPALSQLRTEKAAAQQRLGTVFADSGDLSGITDPTMREQVRSRRSAQYGSEAERIGGQLSDLRGAQSQTTDKLASIFGAETQAKQFGVEQNRAALERAAREMESDQARQFQREQTAGSQRFEGRMDDLTRREKEASIAASNRSGRGGGAGNTVTFQEAVANPLLEFLAKGGRRVQDQVGGYGFFNKEGKPITVDEAMAMTKAGTKADFLAGSKNAADTEFSGQKPPSAAAKQQQINFASGNQSLATLEDLLNNKKISDSEMLTSKSGLSSLLASGNAKKYRDAARNIADIVARVRTGAQINEKEMSLYLQFVPGPSDTPEVRKQKIATLKTIFSGGDVAGPSGASADPSAFEQ